MMSELEVAASDFLTMLVKELAIKIDVFYKSRCKKDWFKLIQQIQLYDHLCSDIKLDQIIRPLKWKLKINYEF